ncbi:hypothetical protein C9374_001591 [Naegleria lovaniensis]|uniref:Methyltransferase FkbM domain-containing protein n=1 Tax=Naegleria lovaniensis TaxID=51637 RepID=A0AA88GX18_NAELO|nr:uncharacterized protein C9374_001591 [Naegleria lovaniensis]KAG2387259.1 hypothetical protein C9374_001591 [Naegleria lovaniensis]
MLTQRNATTNGSYPTHSSSPSLNTKLGVHQQVDDEESRLSDVACNYDKEPIMPNVTLGGTSYLQRLKLVARRILSKYGWSKSLDSNKSGSERNGMDSNFPFCKILCITIIGFFIAFTIFGYLTFVMARNWLMNSAPDLLITQLVRKGNLKHLLHQVIDRVYLYDLEKNEPKLFLGMDTSHDGEFTALVRHMLNNEDFYHYETSNNNNNGKNSEIRNTHTIVDIGAHDCLSGSNSFNFIKMGFDAILVEPFPNNMKLCKYNLERARKSFVGDKGAVRMKQRIEFVEAAITSQDGMSVLGNRDDTDAWGMQFFVDNKKSGAIAGPVNAATQQDEKHLDVTSDSTNNGILVKTMTFSTFAAQYNLPKKFTALSIDAEGQDLNILLEMMRSGYRPLYLIYEGLHGTGLKIEGMAKHGYKLVAERGWNQIYVYRGVDDAAAKK